MGESNMNSLPAMNYFFNFGAATDRPDDLDLKFKLIDASGFHVYKSYNCEYFLVRMDYPPFAQYYLPH